jgi:tetratricopeptide (TPR) repeat protein
MAEAIAGTSFPTTQPGILRDRIQKLEAAPRKDDPEWIDDLAGAYLRLGEPNAIVKQLEQAVARFPTNYGVHANLGTAYHLLGNYAAAEKEIARDLELNPEAHFGLEKYHLALLQYLARGREYQLEHLYIDEWTPVFKMNAQFLSQYTDPATGLYSEVRAAHLPGDSEAPPYRSKWELASDPKFEEGILYMASLNDREPACFTMIGVACLAKRDFNLARAAFQKSLELGSTQAALLKERIKESDEMIANSRKPGPSWVWWPIGLATFGLAGWWVRRYIRRSAGKAHAPVSG